MSREWKPGDIISATRVIGVAGRKRGVFIRTESRTPWTGGDNRSYREGDLHDVRPLVVIDPEDREQVERMTGALAINGANPNDRNYWRETQAALRSFITPPKPEEPTARWSRVEDVKGQEWIRVATHGLGCNDWNRVTIDAVDGARFVYDQIAAVKVLSPGWSE